MKVRFADRSSRIQFVFKIVDIAFSCFVLLPLVVIYWFTTWKLSDIYLSPENSTVSAAISFAIGFIGQFVTIYFQVEFETMVCAIKWHLVRKIISKFYALIFAISSISFWRGMWVFADLLSTTNDNTELILDIVQNSLILMLAKVFKNTISTPFIILTDEEINCFSVATYFKLKVKYSLARAMMCG